MYRIRVIREGDKRVLCCEAFVQRNEVLPRLEWFFRLYAKHTFEVTPWAGEVKHFD